MISFICMNIIVQLFSFDRAEQPLNLNNGKLLFTIHCVLLVHV